MNFLNSLFGTIIRFFCEICGNSYWLGILLFTVIVNLALLPLSIKQQKGTASQARMRNKLERIKEKCGDDRAKYQEEMSKVYSESGSSPFSGCLLMFIRLPIFICIYTAVRQSLTYIYGAGAELISRATDVINSGVLGSSVAIADKNTAELTILRHLDALTEYDSSFTALTNGRSFNFNLFGIDLLEDPDFGHISLIWIIPLLSFAASMLMAAYSTYNNKKTNPETANNPTMGCMMFGMPLFSLYITFQVPGAVGWYWACSNIVSIVISVLMTKFYSPGKLIAEIEAKEAKKRRAYEAAIINPQPTGTGKSGKRGNTKR